MWGGWGSPAPETTAATKNRLYLELDSPNRDSEGTFSQGNPPLLVVSTPVLFYSGSGSTHAVHVPAYRLPNAHVGHLKMTKDFA